MTRKTIFYIFLILLCSCQTEKRNENFVSLDASHTNILFKNVLVESDSLNILDYLYFYNGSGVAIGDLNNDGLLDLYFGANQGEDHIYLNQGNFKFDKSNHLFPKGELEGWTTGVTFVDINSDGFLDIYVCRLGNYKGIQDFNKLFINKNGQSFVEASKEYGLNFSGFSTQALFLDYDLDSDLDCYLLNHSVKNEDQFRNSKIRSISDSLAGDRFYENKGELFVDVTEQAGIYSSSLGFGLGIDAADVNQDGYLDIYVCNDFHEQDYLYINNGDKSFSESIVKSTGHTSNFSMGVTISDINNDGLDDIFSLDMKPFDDEVYKESGGWENLQIYKYKRSFGYHHQSPRNALQINKGLHNNVPIFSEEAGMYNLSATDWSWAPVIFDMDNDGDKDIFITNGITRRPNDLDFIKFYFNDSSIDQEDKLKLIPNGSVQNMMFENQSGQAFERTPIGKPNVSTSAAKGDLNNDGFVDLVVNTIDSGPLLLKNVSALHATNTYLEFILKANGSNTFAFGASIEMFTNEGVQKEYVKSSSGFQSFNAPRITFGLLKDSEIDSIIINWPNGIRQKLNDYNLNRSNFVNQEENYSDNLTIKKGVQDEIVNKVDSLSVSSVFSNPQNIEPWLIYDPQFNQKKVLMLSESLLILQGTQEESTFIYNLESGLKKDLSILLNSKTVHSCDHLDHDTYGLLLSDGEKSQSSVLYLNSQFEVTGEIQLKDTVIAMNTFCKLKIISDEEFMVFISEGYELGHYGKDYKTNLIHYSDSRLINKEMEVNGLVTDIEISDIDNNGDEDFIICGHWMPITIFYNGRISAKKELENSIGLWFDIELNDLNKDGLVDIVGGNFGLNHTLWCSNEKPIQSYYSDFDNNGSFETLLTSYVGDMEKPIVGHEVFLEQLPHKKRQFMKASKYAESALSDLFSAEELNNLSIKQINELQSCYFLQNEDNNWLKKALPKFCQRSCIRRMSFNSDGHLILGYNLFDVDPNIGRQDAGFLEVLKYENGFEKIISRRLQFNGQIEFIHSQSDQLFISEKINDLSFYIFN